jgi:hypothetical protein
MIYPPAAVGAVAAAFITGVFTFVNLVTSKDQKTSEFRQSWIDNLRQDISEFTAAVDHISSLLVYYDATCTTQEALQERYDKVIHTNADLLTKVKSSYYRILLRVNPIEDKKFIKRLHRVHKLYAEGKIPSSPEQIDNTVKKFIKESQILLKREWRRVKKGEVSFWITKYAALALLVIVLIFGYELIKNDPTSSLDKKDTSCLTKN